MISIPASLLRGFEEALLAAVPEPSYLLMPTIATRCWQHVEDLSNRRYYQNQCWCKWWSFHCLNPQFPQKAANGPHGGSTATMGPGDHWEQVFLVDFVGCSWWWGSNICWWHRPFFGRHLFSWLGSLNGDLNSQVPKVPPPSLHSCNVKSVPRCSTRAHTCVQAWTMQHFCRVISVPKTESLWYDILYWRISIFSFCLLLSIDIVYESRL